MRIRQRLLIKQKSSDRKWYDGLVGKTVPYLGDTGTEFKSRQREGYINFVQYEDCEIIEVADVPKRIST